jgi:hypothetical protein
MAMANLALLLRAWCLDEIEVISDIFSNSAIMSLIIIHLDQALCNASHG